MGISHENHGRYNEEKAIYKFPIIIWYYEWTVHDVIVRDKDINGIHVLQEEVGIMKHCFDDNKHYMVITSKPPKRRELVGLPWDTNEKSGRTTRKVF